MRPSCIIFTSNFLSDVYHVKEMEWEVRAKKVRADDADIDGAYARSQDALGRKDIHHSNVGKPNLKNTKAAKASKRLRKRTGSGVAEDEAVSSSDSSSAHAASSSETSSDSEDDDDIDDLQRIISLDLDADVEEVQQIQSPTSSLSDLVPPSDRVTFRWRHRRFVRGKIHGGRLVFRCTCRLPNSKLHVCRHIIRVVHSIFCKHILDISFVHIRTMRLWYNFAVKGGAGVFICFKCDICNICGVTFF